ncbi:MAG: hypothetical protein AVDCRST_MAG60-2053, partial [uncultured Nocardioides sp.]
AKGERSDALHSNHCRDRHGRARRARPGGHQLAGERDRQPHHHDDRLDLLRAADHLRPGHHAELGRRGLRRGQRLQGHGHPHGLHAQRAGLDDGGDQRHDLRVLRREADHQRGLQDRLQRLRGHQPVRGQLRAQRVGPVRGRGAAQGRVQDARALPRRQDQARLRQEEGRAQAQEGQEVRRLEEGAHQREGPVPGQGTEQVRLQVQRDHPLGQQVHRVHGLLPGLL